MASRLTINPKIGIELLPHDHTLIVSIEDAIFMKCTHCGGIKDLVCFMQTLPVNYAPYGIIRCACQDHTQENAPNHGGPTPDSKLLVELNQALGSCQTINDVRKLIFSIAAREDMQ